MLAELGDLQSEATRVYIDNLSCVDGITNERLHADSRWQGIRLAFVREQVRNLLVQLLHISGKQNPADIGTKALGPSEFRRHA